MNIICISHRMRKKILYSSLIFITSVFLWAQHANIVRAQNVEYSANEAIVDTDLDALTDEGETQIFGTDAKDPDTDDDGFYDGIEVLHDTDPLDAQDPLLTSFDATVTDTTGERAPLAWYFSRATGIIAYILLWLVIFLGLSFRNPLLKKFVAPIYKLDMHIFLSLLATAFVFVHGLVLIFDDFINASLTDIFVPFVADPEVMNTNAIAWGIIAFYILIILILTSIFRTRLPQKLWRWLHFLHVGVFILVVVHVLMIGTDFQAGIARTIFIGSVVVLSLLYLISLGEVVVCLRKKYKF